MSAAIAITAFPMLARIIHERGLTGSPLGTLSLSAGAIDDAGAWVLIALLSLPLAAVPSKRVLAGAVGMDLIPVLGETGRLQLVFGVLATVGLTLG